MVTINYKLQGNGQASSCYKPTFWALQIFPTVHRCGNHDRNCASSICMPLTSLLITNSEIFTKVWLCSKGNNLVTGHYQHVIINL